MSWFQFFNSTAAWIGFFLYVVVFEWVRNPKHSCEPIRAYKTYFYCMVSLLVFVDLIFYDWESTHFINTLEWLCIFHYFMVDGNQLLKNKGDPNYFVHHVFGGAILIFLPTCQVTVGPLIKWGSMMEWSSVALDFAERSKYEMAWKFLFVILFAFRVFVIIPKVFLFVVGNGFYFKWLMVLSCLGLIVLHIRWTSMIYKQVKETLSIYFKKKLKSKLKSK